MTSDCDAWTGNLLVVFVPVVFQCLLYCTLKLDIARLLRRVNEWSDKHSKDCGSPFPLLQAVSERLSSDHGCNMDHISKMIVEFSHSHDFMLQIPVLHEWNTFVTHYKYLVLICMLKCVCRILLVLLQFYRVFDWYSMHCKRSKTENMQSIRVYTPQCNMDVYQYQTFLMHKFGAIVSLNPTFHLGWLIEWVMLSYVIGSKHYYNNQSSVRQIAKDLWTEDLMDLHMNEMKFGPITESQLQKIIEVPYKIILVFIVLPTIAVSLPYSMLVAMTSPLFVGLVEVVYSALTYFHHEMNKISFVFRSQSLQRSLRTLNCGISFIVIMFLWSIMVLTIFNEYTNQVVYHSDCCECTNTIMRCFDADMFKGNPAQQERSWRIHLLSLLTV